MHYHTEIVFAPTDDIEDAVASVMKPFDENQEESEDVDNRYAFWDFYVIGGRFAGDKQLTKYDREKIDAFYSWLKAEGVTVAGMTCGKQEISPVTQIPKVDAKWNELFPQGDVMVACQIFKHSNDQYGRDGKGTIDGDICPLSEALQVKCSRVIFAGPSFVYDKATKTGEYTGPLEAVFMLSDDVWNGVNHMPVAWDGTVADALRQFKERLDNMGEGYRDQMTPQDDWTTVTVDYHT